MAQSRRRRPLYVRRDPRRGRCAGRRSAGRRAPPVGAAASTGPCRSPRPAPPGRPTGRWTPADAGPVRRAAGSSHWPGLMPTSSRKRRVKVRTRHGLLVGHVAQLDRLVEAAQRPGAGGGRGRQLRFGDGAVDVLGLAAVPVRRYDGAAGHLVGDGRAVVAAHDVQAQVDAGGDARRGEHVAVVDEQHVRVDLDLREEPLEVLGASASAWWPGGRRGSPAAART